MADQIDGKVPDSSGKVSWKEQTFTCEGLVYNWSKLIKTMGLILLGFFTLVIAQSFVPSIMPLKLKELGANNMTIVFIMSTIGQIFNITVCPMVSFQSDRYRSKRWGRRVPFILFTMPMMITAWVLFAFVDSEAGFFSRLFAHWINVAPTTMGVVLIALIMVLYQFFNMYVASVIYYIYNDTIPAQFHSRIMGLTRVSTTCAAMVFNFFIFKHGLEHYRLILLLTAAAYTLGMGAMCFCLKEPRFPDPPPLTDAKRGLRVKLAGLKTFFAESFSHRFYWYLYLGEGCVTVGLCMMVFVSFFYMDCGLDLEAIGTLNGWSLFATTAASFAGAIVCTVLIDRWHSVRVFSMLTCFFFLFPLEKCKWLFFSPGGDVFWMVSLALTIAFLPIVYFRDTANLPYLMRLFPKSRFGQICSAQAMVRSGVVLLGGLVYGAIIDFLKINLNLGEYAHRFSQCWYTFWLIAGAVMFALAYREYLKLGGYKAYRAPAPWSPEGSEEMPVTETVGPYLPLLKVALWILDAVFILPLLTSVFFAFWSKRSGMDVEAERFLYYAVPAAAAVLVLWGFVRMGMMRDVHRAQRSEMPKNGIPHHGILMLAGCTGVMLAIINVIQTWMGLRSDASYSPALMLLFECVVSAFFVVAIWVYTWLERGASTAIEE